MPPLQLIKPLGQPVFLSHGLKLPANLDIKSDKDQYGKAWKEDNKIAVPQLIPPWFMPAEGANKDYQDTCDKIGTNFKDFHDAMLDAIQYAHNMWKLQAMFKDIKILAAVAVGAPGCLSGPELESLIKSYPPVAAFTGNKGKHRDAVAKGVSKCFKDWQDQVTVPGLPWYPLFAAFPGPTAPPTPNVPTPMIACVSAKITSIAAPMEMKSAMNDALDGGLKDKDPTKQYDALHDAIATVCAAGLAIWVAAQTQIVLGTGPIPTFAPPYVPVGPVLNGSIIPSPHLAA